MQEKDTDAQEVNQRGPYMDPPGMEERLPATFEPVTLVAYLASGGREIWRQHIHGAHEYAGQLQSVQQELNRGFLARVDLVRFGTTDLIGCLIARDEQQMKFRKYG